MGYRLAASRRELDDPQNQPFPLQLFGGAGDIEIGPELRSMKPSKRAKPASALQVAKNERPPSVGRGKIAQAERQIGRALTPQERHELVVNTAVPRASIQLAIDRARERQKLDDSGQCIGRKDRLAGS